MKINRLKINNFLGIETLDMDLSGAPIHIIAGPNEVGKSSIGDGLKVTLTGEARGLKTKEQQAALIHQGAKAADVALGLADGRAITWHKTPKTAASRTGAIPDDKIMNAILCDPLIFFSLSEDKKRQILFRLISGLTPTDAKIAGILAQIGRPSPELPEAQAEAQAINELATIAAQRGFAAAADEAVTRRRIAKQVRDAAKVEEPDTKAGIGGRLYILPDIQEPEVLKGLAKLREERDKLLKQRGKVEVELDKLPGLKKELAALAANPVASIKTGEIERLQASLKIKRPIMGNLQQKVTAMTAGQDPIAFPETCSACNIPCPSAGKVAIEGTKTKEVDAQALKKAMDDLNKQEEEVARLEKDLQEAQARQTAYEDYTRKRQDLAARIFELQEHQKKVPNAAELDKQIAALDARLQTGQELLEEVRTFWRKKNESEAAAARLAMADKEAVLFDALAKALAPEGIPSRLIAEALGPMNDLLQVAAEHLFPGRTLALNKELNVELSGSAYVILSKSAKFRVGVAFQYALARLAGARLLMIDEADILDPMNRSQLIDFLLEVCPQFDTILVFATSDRVVPSQDPEIRMWWLEEGKISPVMAKQAA